MTTRWFTQKEDVNEWVDWKKLCSTVSDHGSSSAKERWIFRGLPDYAHHDDQRQTSSFDRAIEDGGQKNTPRNRTAYEVSMLYSFKRRAHHYLGTSAVPKPDDFLEWFALMRHWRVPSRLVDFSYSFFVATYFAISDSKRDADAAVFRVNHTWLVGLVDKVIRKGEYFQDPKVFWRYAMPHPNGRRPRERLVIPVNPFRSNDRVHAQQGLFLCPADVTGTFHENLRAMVGKASEAREHITKWKINRSLRPRILDELRAMNINAETLYPGLEGFGQSMKDFLSLPPRRLDKDLSNALISKSPPF